VDTETTLIKRREYALDFLNNSPVDRNKITFIDESGFNLHLKRGYGRSKGGTNASIEIPTVRGRISSLLLAVNQSGVLYHKLIADGTCNASKFNIFISELIEIITVDPSYNGSWIIMDNAKVHKASETLLIIENAGYFLKFLSPYSYMLNPVENAFSKIKSFVKTRLSQRPMLSTLAEIICEGVNSITYEDCMNYHMHMTRNLGLSVDYNVFN